MHMAEKSVQNVTQKGAADCGPQVENSGVQVLFDVHMKKENAEHDKVKQHFRNLFSLLEGLSYDDLDTVTDAVCELCEACEYAGFVGGMKNAIRLTYELNIS